MEYIDLVVLIACIVFVMIYSKRFNTYIFGFGAIDIIFRILNIINEYIPVSEIRNFINKYVPASVPDVIRNYTNGTFEIVLIFVYVVIMAIFLYYIIKIFIKRKRF